MNWIPNLDYNGFKVQYDEDREEFYVSNGGAGGNAYAAPSLKKLKAMIDRDLAAQRKKFAGKEAYKYVYSSNEPVRVTVTSVDEDGKRCWIKYEDGERRKESVADLFEICDANDAVLIEIAVNRAEYARLANRDKELKAALRPISFR
jgi:hypothetical protein